MCIRDRLWTLLHPTAANHTRRHHIHRISSHIFAQFIKLMIADSVGPVIRRPFAPLSRTIFNRSERLFPVDVYKRQPSVRIQTRNRGRQVSGKRDSCRPMLFYIRFLSIRPLSPVDRRCRGYCDLCVRCLLYTSFNFISFRLPCMGKHLRHGS